ncbi:MAG: DUF2092 domain-containing protein [Pseudomonadota bacterium]
MRTFVLQQSARIVGAGLLWVSAVSASEHEALPVTDPDATQLIADMGAFLADLEQFAFDASIRYDAPSSVTGLVEIQEQHEVVVSRPRSLKVSLLGEGGLRVAIIHDELLYLVDPATQRYFAIEAPGSLEESLEFLITSVGVPVPNADFLYDDPARALLGDVIASDYLGVVPLDGAPAHHLVFAQEGLSWQLWIDAATHPVPRRFVMTYGDLPGKPRFSADLHWDLNPVPFGRAAFAVPGRDALTRVDAPEDIGAVGRGR